MKIIAAALAAFLMVVPSSHARQKTDYGDGWSLQRGMCGGEYVVGSRAEPKEGRFVIRRNATLKGLSKSYNGARVGRERTEKIGSLDVRVGTFETSGGPNSLRGVAIETSASGGTLRIDCMGSPDRINAVYFDCREIAGDLTSILNASDRDDVRSIKDEENLVARIMNAASGKDMDAAHKLWSRMDEGSLLKGAVAVKLARIDGAFRDALDIFEYHEDMFCGTRGAEAATDAALAAIDLGEYGRAERYLGRAVAWDTKYLPVYRALAKLKLANGESSYEVAGAVKKYLSHATSSAEKNELREILEEMNRVPAE